jgi:hypothetical protein
LEGFNCPVPCSQTFQANQKAKRQSK